MAPRNPVAQALPRELYIEVTNRCNSRCQTCIRTYRLTEPIRDLELSEFQTVVDSFPVLDRVVLHGIGEPLLNAELGAMIRHTKDRHPAARVLFNSNAILLNRGWQQTLVDARLDEYRVSLDAATASTYARIRGVDAFDQVVANVRQFAELVRSTSSPRLSFWLTAMRENLDELPSLIDLAATLGVPEVYVQRLVLIDHGLARPEQTLYGHLQAREGEVLAEAARRAGGHRLAFRASGLALPQESLRGRPTTRASVGPAPEQPWSACYRPWATTYVTANGNVLPCCISPFSTTDYEGLILGNVFRSLFAEIWNNRKYVERRAALYTAHPLHPCEMCGSCWAL